MHSLLIKTSVKKANYKDTLLSAPTKTTLEDPTWYNTKRHYKLINFIVFDSTIGIRHAQSHGKLIYVAFQTESIIFSSNNRKAIRSCQQAIVVTRLQHKQDSV